MIAIAALIALASLILIRAFIALSFFCAYFCQKQRNAGRDPKEVLRAEFPAVIYYLAFWGRFL